MIQINQVPEKRMDRNKENAIIVLVNMKVGCTGRLLLVCYEFLKGSKWSLWRG